MGWETEKLNLFFDGLSVASYRRANNSTMTLQYISDEIESICGLSASRFDDIGNSDFINLIVKDDINFVREEINKCIPNNKPYSIEYRLTTENYHERWIIDKGKGVYDEDGHMKYLEGVLIDITNNKKFEKALIDSKEQYRNLANQFEAILDHIPGLVFYKNTNNAFVRVNKYVADAYCMTKEELEGRSLFEIYPHDVAQTYFNDDLEVINSGEEKIDIVEPWDTTDGSRWVNTSKIPFVDADGKISGVIGISFDITDRIIAEQKMKILQQAVEQAPDSIVITELDGTICYVNKAFSDLTGYEREEALGKNPRILKLNHEVKVDYHALWETILSGKEWRGVFQNKKRNGDEYWERATISPIYGDDGSLIKFIGIKEDITKEHFMELELERLYRTDALTNVSNRRTFFELAEREFDRVKRYQDNAALLMLDIDFFKRINDKFGHSKGDLALKEFAAECVKAIRASDIIGRIGGEEFAIFLINADCDDTSIIAERIRKRIETIELSDESGNRISFTVSIGVTSILPSDQSIEQILKRADLALYQAKKHGRNCIEWNA